MKACSTYMAIFAEGKAEGLERGRAEGACRQLRKLLVRHGKWRFGPPEGPQASLLDALADGLALPALEALHDRLAGASGWGDLLAGVPAPEPAPPPPDYLKYYDPEPGLDNPGIDEAMQVTDRGGKKRIFHLRLQSLYQEDIGRVVYAKNRALREHYRLPVDSFVILLWSGADGPAMTGRYEVPARGKLPAQRFTYQLQRVWNKTPEECLAFGLGTVPMAPLSNVTPERLPEVVRRMEARIRAKAPPDHAANLWVTACFWMGLRYPAERVRELLRDVWPLMRTSKFYQGTLAAGYSAGLSEGLVEGPLLATRRLLLRQGERRLGPAAEDVRAKLDAVTELLALEGLYERLPEATAWEGLLAGG